MAYAKPDEQGKKLVEFLTSETARLEARRKVIVGDLIKLGEAFGLPDLPGKMAEWSARHAEQAEALEAAAII